MTRTNPAVTFPNHMVRFNMACLKKFENVEYVEMLFNPVQKCIAIRPCDKEHPNAIRWGRLKDSKWIVAQKSCSGFAEPLYQTMDWDESSRYRFRGNFRERNGDKLIVFDLQEPEIETSEVITDEFVQNDKDGINRTTIPEHHLADLNSQQKNNGEKQIECEEEEKSEKIKIRLKLKRRVHFR